MEKKIRENFITRLVEDRMRQLAIDEAVRRCMEKSECTGGVVKVNFGAYAVPVDFIDNVRAEFRKIMEKIS